MKFIQISIKTLPSCYLIHIKLIQIHRKKIIIDRIVDKKILSIDEVCNIINNFPIPVDYLKSKINISIASYKTFIEKIEIFNYKEKKLELKDNLSKLYVDFDNDYQVKTSEIKQKNGKIIYYITLSFNNSLLVEAIKLNCLKKVTSFAFITNDVFSLENYLISYLPKDLFEKHFLYIQKDDDLFIIYEVYHSIVINYLLFEINEEILGDFINKTIINSIDCIIINSSFKFFIAFTEKFSLKNTIYAGYLEFFKYFDERRALHEIK